MDVDRLAILSVDGREFVLGELGTTSSEVLMAGAVVVHNPFRLSRAEYQNRQTGQIVIELRYSDYDFIDGGTIEIVPQLAFYLSWLNDDSQKRYLVSLLNFLEGKMIAKAQAAGIETPKLIKP